MREGARLPASRRRARAAASLESASTIWTGSSSKAARTSRPKSYGEAPLKPEWAGDCVRDQYEIGARCASFSHRKKPVLGICRGAQLLNVALGGTLYQDIATQVPGARAHRDWDDLRPEFPKSASKPAPACRALSGVRTGAKVNSVHHQAIKDSGPGLRVEARSEPDGIDRSDRCDGAPATSIAVQWHPEFHDPSDHELLDGRLS